MRIGRYLAESEYSYYVYGYFPNRDWGSTESGWFTGSNYISCINAYVYTLAYEDLNDKKLVLILSSNPGKITITNLESNSSVTLSNFYYRNASATSYQVAGYYSGYGHVDPLGFREYSYQTIRLKFSK